MSTSWDKTWASPLLGELADSAKQLTDEEEMACSRKMDVGRKARDVLAEPLVPLLSAYFDRIPKRSTFISDHQVERRIKRAVNSAIEVTSVFGKREEMYEKFLPAMLADEAHSAVHASSREKPHLWEEGVLWCDDYCSRRQIRTVLEHNIWEGERQWKVLFGARTAVTDLYFHGLPVIRRAVLNRMARGLRGFSRRELEWHAAEELWRVPWEFRRELGRFHALAMTCLKNALEDLRRNTRGKGRPTIEHLREADDARTRLSHELGRKPTSDEIIAELKWTKDKDNGLYLLHALKHNITKRLQNWDRDGRADIEDARCSCEEEMMREELDYAVNATLDRLPRQRHSVVICTIMTGMSDKETARHLGLTPGAVRYAREEALKSLRVWMGKYDSDL